MKDIRIGFISSWPINDRKASSGTNYTIAQAFHKIGNVTWIPATTPRLYRVLELLAKFITRLLGKNINFSYTILGSKMLANGVHIEMFKQFDLLVAFFSGSQLGQIDTLGKPVIYISDATFPAMIDFYPPFSHLPSWNIRQGYVVEKASLDVASAIILSSDWAARSAISDLHQNAKKVHIVEYGANIDEIYIRRHKYHNKENINLIFIGVDWERKGGNIAVEVTKWLNEQGVHATLYIVGIQNLKPDVENLPYIKNEGFLNKNIPSQYHRLVSIIDQCHAMLLPTKAECAGIAFAEACAYGLPVFTHKTGGTENYVKNGVNGYAFPLGASPEEFGAKIKSCFTTGELKTLSMSARLYYEERLNWNEWTNRVSRIVDKVMSLKRI